MAYETVDTANATAITLLATDPEGVIGQTIPNQISLLLAKRMVDAGMVNFFAALDAPDLVQEAANFDSSYCDWALQVETLLDRAAGRRRPTG